MAGKDIKRDLGLGGASANKVRLVADLASEYAKLNTVLKETKKLSEDIANNLRKASGKKGGGTGSVMGGMDLPPVGAIPMSSPGAGDLTSLGFQGPGAGKLQVTTPTGFVDPAKQSVRSQVWDNFKKNIGQFALTTAAAGTQAVDLEGMITNEVTRRRFGLFSGNIGTQAGSTAMNTLMSRGTFMNYMDAAGAVSAGSSMGMMPGLKNYDTVLGSTAAISNLMPGVSGEQAMGAVAGLNQARSVNMLRMIGINVRDEQGLMRGFEEIANDLWRILDRSKGPGGKITAEDLSYSLQPGNSLDMLLNQYFGNDPVLRQSVVAALYQKAGGGSFSKESTKKTGANPAVTQSFGERRASEYKALDKYTGAGVDAVTNSNNILRDATNVFADATGLFKSAVDVFVSLTGFTQNLSTGFNGGMGTFGAGLLNFGSKILGPVAKSLFGPGGEGVTVSGTGPSGRGYFTPARRGGGIGGEGTKVGTGSVAPLGGSLTTPTDGEFGNFNKKFRTRKHRGVDFVANVGDPVYAIKDGVVVNSGDSGELGNMVRIKHDDGYRTVYAHLDRTAVDKSEKVSAGELIGYAGNTGKSTGPHLHLALEQSNGSVVDPAQILSGAAPSSYSQSSEDGSDGKPRASSLWSQTEGRSLWSSGGGIGGEGIGGDTGGSSISYGGVTVNINVPTGTSMNEEKLAREIKRVLADEEQFRMAVSR